MSNKVTSVRRDEKLRKWIAERKRSKTQINKFATIHDKTLGGTWAETMKHVFHHGYVCHDEGRERKATANIRVISDTQIIPDGIIERYGDKDNLESLIELTFDSKNMYDFDVNPSFAPGAKSYFARMVEGNMYNYVVDRLTFFPESKKAVISFILPTEDYAKIMENHNNDYLPCMALIQFRVRDLTYPLKLDTTFFMRSTDVAQKLYGNLWVTAMLNNKICADLSLKLGYPVTSGYMDGLITDAHVYVESYSLVEKVCHEI